MENWLTKRARLTPNQVALYYQDNQYTFAQVYAKTTALARKFARLNLPPQTHVAVFGKNSWQMYLNILALQQLNLTLVLLNTRLSTAELQSQIDDAQIKYCLADDDQLPDNLAAIVNCKIFTPSEVDSLEPAIYTPFEIKETEIASIMYTSGTTGKPKGVLQTYGNHFASAMNTMLNFQVTHQDAWLCAVPLFHISGFSIILRSLIYGIPVYLEPKFSAARCNQLLITQKVTIFSVVPTMLTELLADNSQQTKYNKHFRIMFLGGAPIDAATLQTCQQRQIPVVQSYGMTETCSNIVALAPADAARKIGSSGQALFANQLRISADGEIQLKSPALTIGYWRNEELFQQKLTSDGWFKTGDVGYLDSEGFLFVKGRRDDMFVSGGENIFPAEIENLYHQVDGIEEIVVTHQTDTKWRAVPIAYIKASKPLSSAKLRDFGRKHLAHYKVPREFRQVDHFKYTGSGKIIRKQLQQLPFSLL